uniref:Uncharacterized protein LOC114346888 isoform X1 n=2 Tax=Diabrotica virgifera virgifera TaxID=50390 RepID=A0A6P7GV98_DIAVI
MNKYASFFFILHRTTVGTKMSRRKRMSEEERLQRKRECEKRRRQKIKNDPVRLAAHKEMKHERYERNKANGTIKLISQISLREKRSRRKNWRENSKRYQAKKKLLEKIMNETPKSAMDLTYRTSTPLQFLRDFNESETTTNSVEVSRQKLQGRKVLRRDRAKCYRDIQKLKSKNKNLRTALSRYV